MEIEIITLRSSIVYTSLRLKPRVALLGDRVTGSYHGVGAQVYAWVAGWGRDYNDVKYSEWVKYLDEIKGSCHLAYGRSYYGDLAVRYPESANLWDYIESLCISAKWVDSLDAYIISQSDRPYLDYLGVSLR